MAKKEECDSTVAKYPSYTHRKGNQGGYGEAVWLGNCESGLTNGTACESGDKAGSTIWSPTACPNLGSYQFSPCLQELVCHVKRSR